MALARLVAAVLVSSLSVVPLYLAVIVLSGDWDNDFPLAPFLATALVIAVAGVVLVGLPVHLVLAYLKKQRALFYAIPGFVAPAAVVLSQHPFGEDGALWIMRQGSLMGIFGACVALVFWGVAVGRRASA